MSTELILLASVCLFSLLVALSSTRDSVVAELSDVVGSVQDLNQSYSYSGTTGQSVATAGSNFGDAIDFCDNPDDIAGQADNCIVFDVPPSNEIYPPPTDDLVLLLDFEDGTSDSSESGNNGIPVGDPTVGDDGTITFDGDDAINIANTDDINLGIQDERTISLDFNADDVTTRQVLYEEGAGVRGLVIYIDDGLLYIGGWNIPGSESGWDPTYISTPISAGEWLNVTLTLDGTPTIQAGSLTGFLNGAEFGSAAGSQLWSHPGGIGVGAINGATIFHDGVQNSGANFAGMIDDVYLYNSVLSGQDISNIANQ